MRVIDPNLDGITHINVYSGSRTELGRMLSNFCREEIYTKDGWFMSVEAYWFWLGISPDCKERKCMRDLREVYPGEQIEDFQDRIIRAIWYKAKRHTDLFLPEYENLPLKHYYVNRNGSVRDVYGKYWWMIEAEEKMKKYIYEVKKQL